MRVHTPLCDLFGIEHPIMLAGMGGAAGPALAAAVTNAGGIGVLGAAGSSPDGLNQMIARTRELTSGPFGVDTLLPASVPQNIGQLESRREGPLIPPETIAARDAFMEREGLTAPERPQAVPEALAGARPQRRPGGGGFVGDSQKLQLECVLDNKVPLYVAGLGDPGGEFVRNAHQIGMKVMVVTGNTRHAQKAIASGCDAVVAQGTDGGGHNSPVGTMALIPQVVDAVAPLPVVGAGGIADGRGIVAALVLGAVGVWLGTVFLATDEASIALHQKQAILDATDRDTVVSRSVTGKPARMIRGKWAEVYERGEIEALPMPLQSTVSGPVTSAASRARRADIWPGFAGQSAGLVAAIRPAAEVMADLVSQTVELLDGVRTLRGIRVVE